MARPLIRTAPTAFLCLALFTTRVFAQPVASVPPTIPLCETFKDLRAYAGKTVALRGQLYSSSEISALGAHCDIHFVTKYSASGGFSVLPEQQLDYVWPDALNLAVSVYAEQHGEKLDFRTDTAAVDRFFEAAPRQRAKFANREVETWLTVIGKILLKDRYDVGRTPDGRLIGGGFGHLSIYPGQLVIKTVLDPVVIEKVNPAK